MAVTTLKDRWRDAGGNLTDPAESAKTVTPSDSVDLSAVCRAILILTDGTLRVTLAKDTVPISLGALSAGTQLVLRVKRVHATGTTASVAALY